jgi:Tol biopolymer transport system component
MTSQSSSSDKAAGRCARFGLWSLVLVVSLALVVIWMILSSEAKKAGMSLSKEASDLVSLQKSDSSAVAVSGASSLVQAPVRSVLEHPAVLFDSNKVSGGLLFSKGRDDKFIPDSDAPSGWDLWVRDASGTERLVNASVFSARFSPDGQQIAYTTSDGTLRVEDLQGNKLAEVAGGYSPQWKSDGSAIVFAKVPEGRNVYLPETLHLATLDPVSGKMGLLTDGRFDDGRPEFHPSGDWILFVSGARNGFASFWKVDPQGGEPVQVTNIGQQAVDETFVPTPYRKTIWSADGRWFLYDFKSGAREQIWGLQFGTDGKLVRASKFADGLNPSWTQDGRTFAYSKRVNGQIEPAVGTLP